MPKKDKIVLNKEQYAKLQETLNLFSNTLVLMAEKMDEIAEELEEGNEANE